MSEAIYHRRYREPDKLRDDGSEIEWPVPFWFVDIGATMQNIMLAAVNEGLGCGFVGPDINGLRAYLGIPDEFVPIGVMPLGRPLPDVRSPSLKRGWVPLSRSPAGSAGTWTERGQALSTLTRACLISRAANSPAAGLQSPAPHLRAAEPRPSRRPRK